jgi:TetR/AcrR family transcriptional regulator
MARPRGTGERGEHTRAKILETAEGLFGERGFAETRLEDVAEAVGIRRAALVYYFSDKKDLYQAVIEEVFGGLVDCLAAAGDSAHGPVERIEAMATAWVDFVTTRPAAARLYLREISNAGPDRPPAIAAHVRATYERAREIVREGERQGLFHPVSPLHLIGMIAGASLMFVAGIPWMRLEPTYDPLSPTEIETHRNEIVQLTRRMLGVTKAGAKAQPPRRRKRLAGARR